MTAPHAVLRSRSVGALALAALLGACTVGPDYQPPVPEAADAFDRTAELDWSIDGAAEPEAAWWARLDDPVLTDLVERARLANPDLAAAEASLAQARALLGLERWDRLPSGSARAGADYSETSAATLPDGFADQVDRDDVYYSAGLDAVWELDLFGRVRRSIEAQAARVEATEADRRAVFVAVAGEVGRTYMELRGTQLRLRVARENVDNQAESLELVDALLDAGRGTQLDVSQARAQLETTRASVPRLEAAEARAIHRLSVLVGEPPGALRPLLEPSAALPPVPQRIAVGDPAALLRRRPDVTAAERRLAAATADIGVAVADLFPRVTLSGSVGHLATSLGDLGSADTRTLSFGPFLQWAAFDLGRVRDRIEASEAGADLRLAIYEKTVLTALEETENALVRLDRAREAQARLQVAEAAAAEAADLAELRYRRGLDSFLVVLDAEARRLAAQDALAQSAVETGAAFVALYEALGGGWEVTVDAPPAAPSEARAAGSS